MKNKNYSRAKFAYKNIIWGVINKMVSILGPFVIRSFMIKIMGGEYAGLSSLFTSILQVLNLAELGVSSAIVFSMYEPIATDNKNLICALYKFYRKAYFLIGCIILLVGIIFIPFIPNLVTGVIPQGINLIYLYLIYLFNTVISYFMFGYKEALLIAYQRSDIASNILTISNIFLYLIQLIFIILIPNYYLYSFAIPISTVIANFLRSYIVDKTFPEIHCIGKLNSSIKKDLYKRVTGLMLYKISQVFRNSFDSIILSVFLGLMAVTCYQNYYYIMNSVAALLSILSNAIIAGIGNSVVMESIEKNKKDMNIFFMLYNWLSGWCSVCLLCLYQDFMQLWLGSRYVLSMDIVVLFCIYFYSMRIGDIAAVYRQATGLWWEDKLRPIVESLVNLFLNVLSVKTFGIAGVLISTIISIIFINIPWASYILFKYYFKSSVLKYYLRIFWNALIVSLSMIVTYFLCSIITVTGIRALVLKGIVCCIVPNCIYFFIYRKTSEFKPAILLIKKMIGGNQ